MFRTRSCLFTRFNADAQVFGDIRRDKKPLGSMGVWYCLSNVSREIQQCASRNHEKVRKPIEIV